MQNEINQTVRRIVLETLELSPAELDDATEFKTMEVNSLMALDILAALEKVFKVKFGDNALRSFTSINSICAKVEESLQPQAAKAG